MAQRPKQTPPASQNVRRLLLRNLIRVGELASLFNGGNSFTFLLRPTQIDSCEEVDELIHLFLKGVNNNHFPVSAKYWSDDETLEHPALQGWIPVKPKGFDNWHYGSPIKLITILAGIEEDPDPALNALASDYPQFDKLPWTFKLSDLPPIIEKMDLTEPLCFLTDLIRMATRRTGTFFLDHSPAEFDFYQDRGGTINWSAENINWLKADWQLAKPIHERAWQLIDWTREKEEKRTKVLMEIILATHERITS
ncbi:MAG: hypothetical protein ACPGWR_02450 [Ardenticatenaceae bacterium]